MPPPGKDALFNGCPGCVASATRSFFSFTSTSVVPPTRMKSINYVGPMGHRDGESASTAGIELRGMGSAFFGNYLDGFNKILLPCSFVRTKNLKRWPSAVWHTSISLGARESTSNA
jgi:hypothetical protein